MIIRESSREFSRRYNSGGNPFCSVPSCNNLCDKFKNGNWRKFCDLHNSYSLLGETNWAYFRVRHMGNTCATCGSEENLELDHIKALVNGGKQWEISNLQTLCKNCHKKKTKIDLKQNSQVQIMKEIEIEPKLK